jgi:hypothetical protein
MNCPFHLWGLAKCSSHHLILLSSDHHLLTCKKSHARPESVAVALCVIASYVTLIFKSEINVTTIATDSHPHCSRSLTWHTNIELYCPWIRRRTKQQHTHLICGGVYKLDKQTWLPTVSDNISELFPVVRENHVSH